MADEEIVILTSQDSQEFKVTAKAAKLSETIKNLINDAGIEAPIPLPNVTGQILAKVVEYVTYHTQNSTANVEDDKSTNDVIEWDLNFCKVDQTILFELILAANYLDIKDLLDLCCKTIADKVKGKDPEEIRKAFNITDDFTEEEKEQVRRENEWLQDN